MLTPLLCATCGAPVPLGEGNPLTCPFCQGRVEVPEAYDRVRQSMRLQAADEASAARLYQHLAGPPGAGYDFAMTVLALYSVGLTGLLGVGAIFGLILAGAAFFTQDHFDLVTAGVGAVSIALMFVPISTNWFFHAQAARFHVDWADMLSGGRLHAVLTLVTVLAFGIPIAMIAFYDALEDIRKKLQAVMQARPPDKEGGPCFCRQCGAPLHIPPEQLGTRCLYCGTDNLVTLAGGRVASAEAVAQAVHRTVQDAAAEEHRLRQDAWKTPIGLLAAALLLVPLLWGMGQLGEFLVEDSPRPPDWKTSVAGPARLFSGYADRPEVVSGQAATLVYSKVESHVDEDGVRYQAGYYFVPLRRGHGHLHVEVPEGVKAEIQARVVTPWYKPEWRWQSVDTRVQDFVAPYDGWYRIKLGRLGESRDPVAFTFSSND